MENFLAIKKRGGWVVSIRDQRVVPFPKALACKYIMEALQEVCDIPLNQLEEEDTFEE